MRAYSITKKTILEAVEKREQQRKRAEQRKREKKRLQEAELKL